MDNLEKIFSEIEKKKEAQKNQPEESTDAVGRLSSKSTGSTRGTILEKKRTHSIQILSSTSGAENKHAAWTNWMKSIGETKDNSPALFMVVTVVFAITVIIAGFLMYRGVNDRKEIRSIIINKESEQASQIPVAEPSPGVDVCNGVPSLVYEPKVKKPTPTPTPEPQVTPPDDPETPETEESRNLYEKMEMQ